MTDWPDHFCPGCGAAQRPFPRYPWYFCKACLKTACDRDDRTLSFFNTSFGGGFGWAFDDEDVYYTQHSHALCLINRRPVIVHEARFGGIVAEPVPDNAACHAFYSIVDLRNGKRSDKPLEPIKKSSDVTLGKSGGKPH